MLTLNSGPDHDPDPERGYQRRPREMWACYQESLLSPAGRSRVAPPGRRLQRTPASHFAMSPLPSSGAAGFGLASQYDLDDGFVVDGACTHLGRNVFFSM